MTKEDRLAKKENTGYWSSQAEKIHEGDVILLETPGSYRYSDELKYKSLYEVVFDPRFKSFVLRPLGKPTSPFTHSLNLIEAETTSILTVIGSVYSNSLEEFDELSRECKENNENSNRLNQELYQKLLEKDAYIEKKPWWSRLFS